MVTRSDPRAEILNIVNGSRMDLDDKLKIVRLELDGTKKENDPPRLEVEEVRQQVYEQK